MPRTINSDRHRDEITSEDITTARERLLREFNERSERETLEREANNTREEVRQQRQQLQEFEERLELENPHRNDLMRHPEEERTTWSEELISVAHSNERPLEAGNERPHSFRLVTDSGDTIDSSEYGARAHRIRWNEDIEPVEVNVATKEPNVKKMEFTNKQKYIIKKVSKVLNRDLIKYKIVKPRGKMQIEVSDVTLYQDDLRRLGEEKELVVIFDHGNLVFQ